jgi:hypothetical protein
MEVAIQVQIDADCADTVRVISSSSPDANTSNTVFQANLNIPEVDEAQFCTINSDWTIISRAYDNPVHEDNTQSFVVQSDADSIYYRITESTVA